MRRRCGFASVANIYKSDLKTHMHVAHGVAEWEEANMVMIVLGAINVQFNFNQTHVGTRWVRSHNWSNHSGENVIKGERSIRCKISTEAKTQDGVG